MSTHTLPQNKKKSNKEFTKSFIPLGPNILFYPTLAELVGTNAAILLAQIDYWLDMLNGFVSEIEGERWLTLSAKQMQRFGITHLSRQNINRAVERLEAHNLIKVDYKPGNGRTKSVALNYETLAELGYKIFLPPCYKAYQAAQQTSQDPEAQPEMLPEMLPDAAQQTPQLPPQTAQQAPQASQTVIFMSEAPSQSSETCIVIPIELLEQAPHLTLASVFGTQPTASPSADAQAPEAAPAANSQAPEALPIASAQAPSQAPEAAPAASAQAPEEPQKLSSEVAVNPPEMSPESGQKYGAKSNEVGANHSLQGTNDDKQGANHSLALYYIDIKDSGESKAKERRERARAQDATTSNVSSQAADLPLPQKNHLQPVKFETGEIKLDVSDAEIFDDETSAEEGIPMVRILEMEEALASACKKNLSLSWHAAEVSKYAMLLLKAGYSAYDVANHSDWWYRHDWRGKKGDIPRLSELADTLSQSIPTSHDPQTYCPPPRRLAWLKPLADPNCPKCHGDGWYTEYDPRFPWYICECVPEDAE